MRVGLLAWSYLPAQSGLAHAAREIAESIAAAGHDIRVLTIDRRGTTVSNGVEVIGCGLRPGGMAARIRSYRGVGHLVAPFAFAFAVLRARRARAFDVIEATNWFAPGLFIAVAPRRRMAFVTRNSTPVAQTARPPRMTGDRIDQGVARALERASARAADGAISNTQAHGAKIARLYGTSPPGRRAGTPGHAVIGLSLAPAFVAAGQAAGYPDDGPVVLLFVGRAEPRKGFDAIAAALCLLGAEASRAGVPDFRAILVGVAADDVASLPDAARCRIETLPRVSDDAIIRLYAAAHIVLAPSRYESFGLVYQEALAFGRPVVACAEDPSACAFIGAAGAGVLATRCTGADVADAIRRLLMDRQLRASLHAASRRAGGAFSRARLAADTIAAYRDAVDARRGRAPS